MVKSDEPINVSETKILLQNLVEANKYNFYQITKILLER